VNCGAAMVDLPAPVKSRECNGKSTRAAGGAA
jgi:hypothetical protein